VFVVFWGLLLVIAPLIAARFETRVLHRPLSYFCIVVLLAVILTVARWRTDSSARSAEELAFEEEYPPELLALGLDGS
jgi:hypothetical protein